MRISDWSSDVCSSDLANFVGTIMADKVAGLTVLYSTMMALFHRARTGEGQEVEVGMFETMASFMLVEHANGAMFDPPLSAANYPRVVAPNRKPYRTKEGHVAALIYHDKHWKLRSEECRGGQKWGRTCSDRSEA